MHDFGGIVWIILVVIGVISSISKNAKKARGQRQRGQAQPQSPQPAPRPPAQRAAPVRNIVDILVAGPAAVPAPRPVMPPAPVPAQARSGPQPSVNSLSEAEARSARSAPIGTSPIRGMFEGPATLIRAIVAAEVLGPPKSLQEQSIWSPRHSEPSI